MMRFREGIPTAEDISFVNDRKDEKPPLNCQVATYCNKDRDAINSAIFDAKTRKSRPANNKILDIAMLSIFMDGLDLIGRGT